MTSRQLIAGILTTILLGLSLVAPSPAQQVRGWVVDHETGEAIENARVIFSCAATDGRAYTLRTEEDGFYQVLDAAREAGGCEGDTILVHVLARGYATIELRIPRGAGPIDRQFELQGLHARTEREFKILYCDLGFVYEAILPHCTNPVRLSMTQNTITVNESAETLELIEEIVRQEDAPPRQVWVEVLLVLATGEGDEARTFPAELATVVDKLGPLFRFIDYEIVGRASSMAMEGAEIHVTSTDAEEEYRFHAGCRIGHVDDNIRLRDLSVGIDRPINRMVNADVSLRDGDMAILGASQGDPTTGSLIIVVTAKVLD